MSKQLYLFALAGLLGFSACQRSTIGGFQTSHTESFASKTTAPKSTPAQGMEAVAFTNSESTALVDVEPVASKPVENEAVATLPVKATAAPLDAQLAQLSDQLVASAKGTKNEARALKLKATLDKALAQRQVSANAAPRKLNFAEKMVTKMVTKKINKQVKDAQQANKTQALDSFIVIGIIFLAAALVFALIPGTGLISALAAIIGVVFLVIGLLNQMG